MCIWYAPRPRLHRFLQPGGEAVPGASPEFVVTPIACFVPASVPWLSETSNGTCELPARCGTRLRLLQRLGTSSGSNGYTVILLPSNWVNVYPRNASL